MVDFVRSDAGGFLTGSMIGMRFCVPYFSWRGVSTRVNTVSRRTSLGDCAVHHDARRTLSGLSRPAGIAALPCCRRERSLTPFRRISFTVASVSRACRFHLCACIKSLAGAVPGIRSDVGAGVGLLSHAPATSGSAVAPRSGFGEPTPSRFLVCCKSFDARCLASCFLRYSDFMPIN
jgi:hypothetical protein